MTYYNSICAQSQTQAGPQRSRMLATLYKDERSSRLDVFPFLEKVYLERILRRWVEWDLCLMFYIIID